MHRQVHRPTPTHSVAADPDVLLFPRDSNLEKWLSKTGQEPRWPITARTRSKRRESLRDEQYSACKFSFKTQLGGSGKRRLMESLLTWRRFDSQSSTCQPRNP